jgi:hypothetical protein
MSRRWISGVAVLALAGLAGCGGSSKSGLSRSQLVAKADAVCTQSNQKAKQIPAPADLVQNANAAAAYFKKVVPIAEQGTNQLAALKPDSAAKADWTSYITLRQQGVTLLKTIEHKASAHDPSGIADLQKSNSFQQQLAAAANKLGAKACAQ